MTPVFLDNNATTRVDPAVVAAMLPYFTEHYGNPSSHHTFGAAAAHAVRRARQEVASLIGAGHDKEIVFTSGGTEADALAIHMALKARPDRREVITSAVEHPAMLRALERLEEEGRCTLHRIGVDGGGLLDLAAFRSALGEKTALVSLMWANNETGALFPVVELAELAHEAGALFHTDAVQAAGKLAIDLKETAIDFLSLSAHKLHGPKGIGALYVRKGIPAAPLQLGGTQERGRRAGTENTAGIVGFGAAAVLAQSRLAEDGPRIAALRDRLESGLIERIPAARMLGNRYERVGNTSLIAFEGVESDAILTLADRLGIAASIGSACSSGSMEASHVLRAMRVPDIVLHGAVRFSLSRETTEAEIERVIEVLPEVIARLRGMSPFWREEAVA